MPVVEDTILKCYNNSQLIREESSIVVEDTILKCYNNLFHTNSWEGLPDNGYRFSGEKCLTFVFTDGTEIEVPENRLLPDQIQSGFFDIEMELAVKH